MMNIARFPRLAAAWTAEQLYQERRARERRRGIVSAEVAFEDITRSFRTFLRGFDGVGASAVRVAESLEQLRAASEAARQNCGRSVDVTEVDHGA